MYLAYRLCLSSLGPWNQIPPGYITYLSIKNQGLLFGEIKKILMSILMQSHLTI
jgi:hypothetical protein